MKSHLALLLTPFACLGLQVSAPAQVTKISVKLTANALGLGSGDVNDGSTVDPDLPGRFVTSPASGQGSVLTVLRSGLAGPGSAVDPLLATITAKSHLDTVAGLPAGGDYQAGAIFLTKEASGLPDGRDEGLGVRAFTVVPATGKRVLDGGLAKIEGSKDVSGGTGPASYDKSSPNGAPHVDEVVLFEFNPALAVLAAQSGALLSKFQVTAIIDLSVTLASGVTFDLPFQGTANTGLFEAVSAKENLWRVNLSGVPGIGASDLLRSFSIRANDDKPASPSGTAEHFLVSGFTAALTSACTPGVTVIGTPAIGKTVTLVMTGAPGCSGCLAVSTNAGPTLIAGVSVPLGQPAVVLIAGPLPPGASVSVPAVIPKNPAFVGLTIFGVVALFDPSMSSLTISSQIQLIITS